MNTPVRIAISAAFACGLSTFASGAASAMPVADIGLAPATEKAHAVRVCNRGRCWWSYAGRYHGGYRYGWSRPHYGWHGHHYGYGGWRRGWRHHGHWR